MRGLEITAQVYLVHVELVLTSGQFSVASGEFSDEVVTADIQNIAAGLTRLENQG